MDEQRRDAWRQWLDAARDPEVDGFLQSFYGDLDRAVAQRAPRCDQSGRCCDFDGYGHRLYVTGLEIARFLRHAPPPEPASDYPLRVLTEHRPACVYQVDGLCSTHAIRPLGCRVFFCEPGTEDWQQQTYERFMNRLKAEHERLGLPYAYMEWRAGLAEAASIRSISSEG
ncbi:YkgJ family cysteine cluster protein [Mucisphaera calidilacus]|uniref:YkgJ family cysteine cluster protein n=1 Tax=Mucisphaera calidilacus TaxID=2527982 RepID=A0A518BW73_9BACT|nr:hypothetical protein [Mucisphaera calidilacus]QDU71232.1 hypothetical protein Pan265_10810 [Mucisphaera calidilacus]